MSAELCWKYNCMKFHFFFPFLLMLGVLFVLPSCKASKKPVESANTYSCPMHPDVMGKKGAHCPKCHMALVENASKIWDAAQCTRNAAVAWAQSVQNAVCRWINPFYLIHARCTPIKRDGKGNIAQNATWTWSRRNRKREMDDFFC